MQTHTRLLQRLPSADPIRPLTGSISAPFGSFQPSHRPANANNSPSLTSKQNGCFAATFRRHSWNPSAGTRQRRDFMRSRKAGFVAAVSDLALIMLAEPDMSFAQDGISPHRIKDSTRFGSFGCWRMTGTDCVGAMLYRGSQSSSKGVASNCSAMICLRRDSR